MFKVIGKLSVGNLYCVSVERDTRLLKNGLVFQDEKGSKFVSRTVGMTHYCDPEDRMRHAESVLDRDVENIGEILYPVGL